MHNKFIGIFILFFSIFIFSTCDSDQNPELTKLEFKISPDTLIILDEDTLKELFFSSQPKGKIEFRITQSPKWLLIDSLTGTTDGSIKTIKIKPLKSDLTEGVYKGKISLITDLGGKADIYVMMSVNGHPKMNVNVSEINFPENSVESQLTIENRGTGLLTWSISDLPKWLKLSVASGVLTKGQKSIIKLTCNRNNLDNTTYISNLIINSNSETPQQPLPISMVVPKISAMKLSSKNVLFDFFSEDYEVYLKNNGNSDINWSTTKENYYSLQPSSGSLSKGDSVKIMITLDRAYLQTGTFNSNIIIQNDANGKDTIKTQINNFKNTKWILDRNIVDADFCKESNKIIIVSSNPNKLSIIDPDLRTIETVNLNKDPKCLSVNKNGNFAAIGHNGLVTLVNLTTKSIEKECAISCDALDIILTSNNWAYVFPVRDQWESIHCLNLTTKAETLQTGGSIYAGTVGRLHPSEKWIYGADNNLSPSDIEKYSIENGTAINLYDSPYHGDYPMSGNLWFTEDGDRIFTKGKTVLRTSSESSMDMKYNGSLSCTDNIKSLVHSKITDRIYLVTQLGYYWADIVCSSEVLVFNNSYLNYLDKYPLESFMVPKNQTSGTLHKSEGNYVFVNTTGTKVYVIVKANSSSGILNDWAIQVIDIK